MSIFGSWTTRAHLTWMHRFLFRTRHLWQASWATITAQRQSNYTWPQGHENQSLTLVPNGENSPLSLMLAVHCAVFSWPLDWAGEGEPGGHIMWSIYAVPCQPPHRMLLGAISSGRESRDNRNYVSGLLHRPIGSCISTCVLINLLAKSGSQMWNSAPLGTFSRNESLVWVIIFFNKLCEMFT